MKPRLPSPASEASAMKFKIRYSPIILSTDSIIQTMIQTHIAKAAREVLDALPAEIERLNKLGCTEIAQKLTDLQNTLQEAREEPEP